MKRAIAGFALLLSCAFAAAAQTTALNYQGSLNSGGTPASGNHDLEFALFDSLAGGTQLGTTLTRSNVVVTNGVFSVSLDFGNQFPGANRFLEIRVRPSGGGGFTPLTPRQPVTSSPYSIRSLNAETAGNATNAINATNAALLGGVAAGQYVLTGDPRMTDARNPLPGSTSYIQNQNAGPQASSNFNIAGNGTVGGTVSGNAVNAATQYNIGGLKMLSVSGPFIDSDFGINATASNTFLGERAGMVTTPNPEVTSSQGKSNTFIGADTGRNTTTGQANTLVGLRAGAQNTIGAGNSFFGVVAGAQNTEGSSNAFFGRFAGFRNTSGSTNAIFGFSAGITNTIGSSNTIIGANADTGSNNLTFATAVGSGAVVTTSSTVVLGRTADAVQIPGTIRIATLGAAGATALCRNASNQISTCSSSARYKSNITPFRSGLSLVNQLRPVSFSWKDGGMFDVGLVAEDVARVEPLLTTTNDKGQIEGVKYDRVGMVLVNAVKEQQAEIESLRTTNAEQDAMLRAQAAEIDALKSLICAGNATAAICREKN